MINVMDFIFNPRSLLVSDKSDQNYVVVKEIYKELNVDERKFDKLMDSRRYVCNKKDFISAYGYKTKKYWI